MAHELLQINYVHGQPTETLATLAPIASRPTTSPAVVTGARSGGKTSVGGHRVGSALAVKRDQVLGFQACLRILRSRGRT